ncbi:MAG: hypothetical protein JW994_03210 [Candidatus Omnitrophica bacterium]|nr:hypothetical protein [Candidatus Omnitrophota bacterium]
MGKSEIIIACKCAPEARIFKDIKKAGLGAVELYLSEEIMRDPHNIAVLCGDFPFSYAIHAPNDCFIPQEVAELAARLSSGIVVFHDIYWEDEWKEIIDVFKSVNVKLCIENVSCVHEPLRFIRRYKLARCLDLEHLQLECGGIYEEEFIPVIKCASHIHLTGYFHGSDLWHTHIQHSPEHGRFMLNLLRNSGYSGFVVSEAKVSLQTYEEFRNLKDFFESWEKEMG